MCLLGDRASLEKDGSDLEGLHPGSAEVVKAREKTIEILIEFTYFPV